MRIKSFPLFLAPCQCILNARSPKHATVSLAPAAEGCGKKANPEMRSYPWMEDSSSGCNHHCIIGAGGTATASFSRKSQETRSDGSGFETANLEAPGSVSAIRCNDSLGVQESIANPLTHLTNESSR